MTLFELKQCPNQNIDRIYNDFLENDQSHPLVNLIHNINIKGELNFDESLQNVNIYANVSVFANFLDARYGDNFDSQIKFVWDEQYCFNKNKPSLKNNILLTDELEIKDLVIEQFFLNIPINFSKNYDNINCIGNNYALYDEKTYNEQQETQTDSRWDILKQIKLK